MREIPRNSFSGASGRTLGWATPCLPGEAAPPAEHEEDGGNSSGRAHALKEKRQGLMNDLRLISALFGIGVAGMKG